MFTVIFGVGLAIPAGELRWIWRQPGPMGRRLFSVLIAVPAIALAVTRLFDLPRLVEIGIVLMAISPGAPVALRRSISAGGHHAFAPSLQLCSVALAVVSMPLTIAILNLLYAGHASISPWEAPTGQTRPPAYADGFRDGCESGRASQDVTGRARKDEVRFGSDPQYAQGWSDAFRKCEYEQMQKSAGGGL